MFTITELTIEQRRNNAITSLAHIKKYLKTVLNPAATYIVISMLDSVTKVLRDSAIDTPNPAYDQLIKSLEQAVDYKSETQDIKGKSSCIVYSPSRRVAETKLYEIASFNESKILQTRGSIHVVTETEDWRWLNPENDSARGYRAVKAFVDMNCSKRAIDHIVFPSFIGDSADFRYF